jgi:hypothetical protein
LFQPARSCESRSGRRTGRSSSPTSRPSRARQFPIDEDLSAALAGNIGTDISDASDAENVFERGLADRFLSVYLPMRSS